MNDSNLQLPIGFPIDAENDLFTAALSSALVTAYGYTRQTPYWCAPKGQYCVHCSPCGNNLLERHQVSIYHCLISASGLAFGFDYPYDDTVDPHSLPGYPAGWRWDDEYIDFLMRFAGVTWKRFGRAGHPDSIMTALRQSIGSGFPALLRLGNELEWKIVTGCAENTLSGEAPGRATFQINDWQDALFDLIVITGRTPRSVTYREVLERIENALAYPEHDAVLAAIDGALEHITLENAMDVAWMLTGITGVFIEARWHAGEAFSSRENLLSSLCDDENTKSALADQFFSRYIQDGSGETHGLGWKIWELLGVGPKTGYQPTALSQERLMNPETRAELKRLFHRVFDNDHAVLAGIRGILKGDKA